MWYLLATLNYELMKMLQRIRTALGTYNPRNLGTNFPEAAVLVPITNEAEPKLILTKRAEHLKTHSGQVAFPGGMRDEEDETVLATALREAEEEVGLAPKDVELVGQLSEVLSKYKIAVTPYVGFVDPDVRLTPDPSELDSIFKVPIQFFIDTEPHRIDHLGFGKYKLEVPCWFFEEYEIWGMSAIILMDFFRVTFDISYGSYSLVVNDS